MKQALFRGAALRRLRLAELELSPGRYVALGADPEPLAELVSLAAGQEPPRRGQVLLDRSAPANSPETRRLIAALLERETLPPARDVVGSVARALAARGASTHRAEPLLGEAGLAELSRVAPAALSQRELRSVALAIALAHPRAELLALHEPFSTSLSRQLVTDALERHTEHGAIVLCATTSAADATHLGGAWLCVELGQVQQNRGRSPHLGSGPWQRVLVESTDAHGLATLLHQAEVGVTAELGPHPQLLYVTGPALDVTVRHVLELARQHGIELLAITPAVPPVEALLAARAGFARGAYEAARNAALAPLPPAPPPAPLPGAPG